MNLHAVPRAALLLSLLATTAAAPACAPAPATGPAIDEELALGLRVRGRDLDVASSAGSAPLVQRVFSAPFVSDLADARTDAIAEYRALVERFPSPPAGAALQARVAQLLAESGRWTEVPAALDRLTALTADPTPFRKVLLAAHGRGPLASPAELSQALALLDPAAAPSPRDLDAWASDTLTARYYERSGAPAVARAALGRIAARGLAAWRATTFTVLPYTLVVLGLLLAGGHLLRRRPLPVLSSGLTVAPFSLWHGLKILLLSILAGLGLAVARVIAEKITGLRIEGVETLLLILPLLLYLRSSLRRADLSITSAFGLRPAGGAAPSTPGGQPGPGARAWVTATVVLLGIEQALSFTVFMLARAAGRQAVPGEGLLGPAVMGTPAQALAITIDAVIWAPLLEEIARAASCPAC
jgi:hypothetical protein